MTFVGTPAVLLLRVNHLPLRKHGRALNVRGDVANGSKRPKGSNEMDTTTTQVEKLSRCWLIYWQEIEPTFRRYREAVGVDHVLAEHRAAIAAQPVDC